MLCSSRSPSGLARVQKDYRSHDACVVTAVAYSNKMHVSLQNQKESLMLLYYHEINLSKQMYLSPMQDHLLFFLQTISIRVMIFVWILYRAQIQFAFINLISFVRPPMFLKKIRSKSYHYANDSVCCRWYTSVIAHTFVVCSWHLEAVSRTRSGRRRYSRNNRFPAHFCRVSERPRLHISIFFRRLNPTFDFWTNVPSE